MIDEGPPRHNCPIGRRLGPVPAATCPELPTLLEVAESRLSRGAVESPIGLCFVPINAHLVDTPMTINDE
jgi:hypothetical protein